MDSEIYVKLSEMDRPSKPVNDSDLVFIAQTESGITESKAMSVSDLRALLTFENAYTTISLGLAATSANQIFYVYTDNQRLSVNPYYNRNGVAEAIVDDDGVKKVFYKGEQTENNTQKITNSSAISVLDYIPVKYHTLILTFGSAQNSNVDFLPYIENAIAAAVSLGKILDFPSGYYPVSDTVKQISSAQVKGVPKQTFIIPTKNFPENKWLWVWPIRNGAPRKYLHGMGFQGNTGHTDITAKRVGGLAVKSGCWFSTIKEISISNCFYGGILLNPQHPSGTSGVSDIVNLSIEHIWILDAGSTETYDCFEVNFNDVDSDNTYAENSEQNYPYETGAWTDGTIRDIDISAADTDPKNYDAKGPIALAIYGSSTNKMMFNVLIQRIFTATRKQTHIYIDHPKLYNCQFSNISGETHQGTSGLSAVSGMGEFSVYHVDIINGGQWNAFDNFYANGSLGNNGLHISKGTWLTFRNMTLDINYPGGQLIDDSTKYPKKITLDSGASCITFTDCNIRGFENGLWNLTYKQYRDIFTYIITDNGFNTYWNSASMSSEVMTMQSLDWFTSVSASNTPVNGSSGGTVKLTCSQGTDLSMTTILAAATDGSVREGDVRYNLSDMAASYRGSFFVALRIKINSADINSHYLKLQMFNITRKIPVESVTNELTLFFNFDYNESSSNKLLLLAMGSGSTTTTDFSITITDFVVSQNKYPYIPNYGTVLSAANKSPSFKTNNIWTGDNTWGGANTYTGVNVFNNSNLYIGRDTISASVGLSLGSKITSGTAYMDYFSAGANQPSVRIQSTGGSTSAAYGGALGLYAALINFRGNLLPTTSASYDVGSSTYKFRNVFISGTISVDTAITVGGNSVGVKVPVPTSAVSTGLVGQWAADANYYYVCIAVNTWVRAPLATW